MMGNIHASAKAADRVLLESARTTNTKEGDNVSPCAQELSTELIMKSIILWPLPVIFLLYAASKNIDHPVFILSIILWLSSVIITCAAGRAWGRISESERNHAG